MKTLRNDGLDFVCSTEAELYRARTLLTKEPGTIQWLKENCREGDKVYDIGANIGCYSLMAARLVGWSGTVYAFEPHVGNAHSLLRNVEVNGFGRRVRVITVALSDRVGFDRFAYGSLSVGSSGSQFGPGARVGDAISELKYGVTLDYLADAEDYASLVKIDVDGNELRILRGGWRFFQRSLAPRSVQVEMPPDDALAIESLMQEYGYTKTGNHYTASGQQQIDKGADPVTVINNAIFKKAA